MGWNLRRAYNVDDLRERARRRLPKSLFEFVDRGSEDDATLARNRGAFDRLALWPHVLRDVSRRNQSVEIFGVKQAGPIIVGPTGATSLLWYEGELALAKAACRAGIPYTLSTASITSMERIAEVGGDNLWFQLYMWPERDLSFELADRAARLGFKALVVTVDNAAPPNREYNQRNSMSVPLQMTWPNILGAITHPGWAASVIGRYMLTSGIPTFSNVPKRLQSNMRGKGIIFPRSGSITWDDLRELRGRWRGPLIVKGVMCADDARAAISCGADGVVVSNHGGRSLDSAPAALDALPRIADAIGDKGTVLLDGGIRRGSDIAKAISLGADAVLLGRAPLWGVAAAGEAGADHVLQILMSEFDRVMALLGRSSTKDLRGCTNPPD